MSDRQVVFIISGGHSGSTLLDLILGSHTAVFGVGELHNLDRLVDRPAKGYQKFCRICDGECTFWNRTVPPQLLSRYFSRKIPFSGIRRPLTRRYASIYGQLFTYLDESVIVDSSKTIRWIREQLKSPLQSERIRPRFLYLTRDGRGVVNSKYRKYPERDFQKLVKNWKMQTIKRTAFLASQPAECRMRISYESLTTDPTTTIRSLCAFLELEFEPGMLRYWEHEHHTIGGNTGTRSLIQRYRTKKVSDNGNEPDQLVERVDDRHGDHYQALGLDIRPDLRWQHELGTEALAAFERIGGRTNRDLGYID